MESLIVLIKTSHYQLPLHCGNIAAWTASLDPRQPRLQGALSQGAAKGGSRESRVVKGMLKWLSNFSKKKKREKLTMEAKLDLRLTSQEKN